MDSYKGIKKEFIDINQSVVSLVAGAEKFPVGSDNRFQGWEKSCRDIKRNLSDGIVRVAVVGTIKSGKSTFLNSLLSGDHLKRGAGVVTSFVTRIRKGDVLKATVSFKSPEEVSLEIDQACRMLPFGDDIQFEAGEFDIDQDMDREQLLGNLNSLDMDRLIVSDTRNPDVVLISSYLAGYEKVKSVLRSEFLVSEFRGDSFPEHREFVSDESLSVYVKDIRLDVVSPMPGEGVEFADCQGSDSPNPMHLSQIQEYLLKNHFILYVVSSRTGLRRADIRFLSMIKNMGIMDNIIFVLNADFNEHESVDGLRGIAEKVHQDISLLKKDPEIYVFSALYNLFDQIRDDLGERDLARFALWEKEAALAEFSRDETSRFLTSFSGKLRDKRYSLLFKNPFERLSMVLSGFGSWAGLHDRMLRKNVHESGEVAREIQEQYRKTVHVKALLKTALGGASEYLGEEISSSSNDFFSVKADRAAGEIRSYIRSYSLSCGDLNRNCPSAKIKDLLLYAYREFKHDLDLFVVENVGPGILRYIKETEEGAFEHLETVAVPFEMMVRDAVSSCVLAVGGSEGDKGAAKKLSGGARGLSVVREQIDLDIPSFTAVTRFSARVTTDAVVKLGFFSILKILKRLVKKPLSADENYEALNAGFQRMKIEAEKSVLFHMSIYQENLKKRYFSVLVDQLCEHLNHTLLSSFSAYDSDVVAFCEIADRQQIDKGELSKDLLDILDGVEKLQGRMEVLRGKIEPEGYELKNIKP